MAAFFIMEEPLLTELTEYLKDFITESRFETINRVLEQRTRHITVVLEDLYQPHNASAVLRSCDGFGIQDVHVIENRNSFDPSSEVSIGADQWLSLYSYNKADTDNTTICISALKKKGYKVIATTPHEEDSDLYELDIQDPVALVFGTELEGVTPRVMEQADGFVKIPMYGFSESFNISVSAAICMYDLTTRLRQSGVDWGLSRTEKARLRYEWIKQSVKAGDQLIARYLSDKED